MSFEALVYQFLTTCGLSVSQSHLSERIRAHTNYPSLVSLTDLLDEWELEYAALQIGAEDLKEMEYPFLAHVVTPQGQEDFEIIQNQEALNADKERFIKAWTGIVLWVNGESAIQSEEHNEHHSQAQSSRKSLTYIGIATGLLLFFRFGLDFDLINTAYLLLSIAGVLVSGAIVGYASGIENSISKSFCDIGSSGCQKIIQSDFSKLLPNVHLSDVAFSYFIGLFLAQSFNLIPFGISANLFVIPSTLAFLATLVTLGYQAQKGEWCKLCLMLTGVIWAQMALILFFQSNVLSFVLNEYLISHLLYAFAIGSGWILLKPFVIKSRLVDSQNITLRKWRQNAQWFHALLPLHKQVNTATWAKEVFYGNPEGVLQITLATAPYCIPCAKAHAQLEHIINKYPEDIGVKIRFVIKETNEKDKAAVMTVFKAYEKFIWTNDREAPTEEELCEQIIKDWFTHQNLEQFEGKYTLPEASNDGLDQLLVQHLDWARQFEIEQTPGFFINGYEMPNPHTLTDLTVFLDSYLDLLKAQSVPDTIARAQNQPLS